VRLFRVRSGSDWPEWWEWELDLSLDHLREQMIRRKFSETDLREMLERAKNLREDEEFGRWVAETTRANQDWEVVLDRRCAIRWCL
jgi:hypothetical protein